MLCVGRLAGATLPLLGIIGSERHEDITSCGCEHQDENAIRYPIPSGRAVKSLSAVDKLVPLRAGGMGEVSRTHDSRLNRDVAIKVFAEQFSDRFTREARTSSALNHKNICYLYDVGPNYLVLEYVEGQDLSGSADFGDALPFA